jgi:hypothetical protein
MSEFWVNPEFVSGGAQEVALNTLAHFLGSPSPYPSHTSGLALIGLEARGGSWGEITGFTSAKN